MSTNNGTGTLHLALVLPIVAGCSVMADFDRPLELPDLRDASQDVSFVCENNEDCSALGPCIECTGGACQEASNADGDGDGYFNTECNGVIKGDDCDDGDPDVHPDATERCNGTDDNCDGVADEGDAFGLSWVATKEEGRGGSISPVTGTTGLVWVEDAPPCSTVYSAFVDGAVRYPTKLTECGEDAFIVQRGETSGYAAVWVDWSEGGADIFFRLLNTTADPIDPEREPVNVSDDFEESDMPVLAWSESGYHFASAWLSHDTSVRTDIHVMFNLLEHSGTPLLAAPVELTMETIDLTEPNNLTFGEKVDMVNVDSSTFDGFGVAWAEQGGIRFATVDINEDGTDIENVEQTTIEGTTGAMLPSITWANGKFVVAYAQPPGEGKSSPDVMLAQVTVDGTTPTAQPITLVYDFPREATYPAIGYHEELDEIALAWADGRNGYGDREVRFARLKLEESPALTATFVLAEGDIVLTEPEAYAAGVALGVEPGGGFFVSWTDRTDGDVNLKIGYLECRQ